jgi:hypothetical protein
LITSASMPVLLYKHFIINAVTASINKPWPAKHIAHYSAHTCNMIPCL